MHQAFSSDLVAEACFREDASASNPPTWSSAGRSDTREGRNLLTRYTSPCVKRDQSLGDKPCHGGRDGGVSREMPFYKKKTIAERLNSAGCFEHQIWSKPYPGPHPTWSWPTGSVRIERVCRAQNQIHPCLPSASSSGIASPKRGTRRNCSEILAGYPGPTL